MSKNIPIFIKIIFIGLLIVLFWALSNLVMAFQPNEYDFCEDQGYTSIDWSKGIYLEYKNKDYGRIICSKYFVEGREIKGFNVTDTKWGFVLYTEGEKNRN